MNPDDFDEEKPSWFYGGARRIPRCSECGGIGGHTSGNCPGWGDLPGDNEDESESADAEKRGGRHV